MSRLLAYASSTVLLAVVAIVSMPLMISASGLEAWASAAVGQSVGGVAFVLISLGWGVNGPALVAVSTSSQRRLIYVDALVARLVAAVIAIPIAVLVAIALVGQHPAFALAGVLSTGLTGITSFWYFTGTGQAWILFFAESVPRVLGTLVGTVAMVSLQLSAMASLWGTILGVALAGAISSKMIIGDRVLASLWERRDKARKIVGGQGAATWAAVLGAVSLAAPLAIVARVSPGALGVFTVMDKVAKQAITAAGPVHSVLQGWVPRAQGREQLHRRSRVAAAVGSILTLGSVSLFAVFGTKIISLLSAGDVHATRVQSTLVGLMTGLYLLEAVMSRAIVIPNKGVKMISRPTTYGVIVGTLAVVTLAARYGATGAMCGVALGLGVRCWLLTLVLMPGKSKRSARLAPIMQEDDHAG